MILTYRYRLSPTAKQHYILDDVLFQMQTVYNDALNERRWMWQRSRKSVSYADQWKRIKVERYNCLDEMGLLNVTSIQQMLRRLDKSYKAFYKGIRGLPRFKGRNRFKSLEYRHGDGSKLDGDRLYIQHVGSIKVRLHRPLPDNAVIKQVIIKKHVGNWYASFQIELPDPQPEPHTGQAVGLDVGMLRLATLSDGEWIENPRWLRNSLKRKRVLNRKLSRQKRYGSGWRKTVKQIAKLDEHIANQRKDFWHKATAKLVDTYSAIVIEDLNLSFMTRGKLSLSAHDASLGMFRQFLTYKAVEAGAQVIAVNPQYTSQACAGCGVIVSKSVKVRQHNCPDCGLSLDRDINAAFNILARGGWPLDRLTYPVGESVLSEAPLL